MPSSDLRNQGWNCSEYRSASFIVKRTRTGRPAIAVLPFDNSSPDPEQAYFADGLAEDLITRLSSWRAFPVIARNSSFHYRGDDLDLKRVGDELDRVRIVEKCGQQLVHSATIGGGEGLSSVEAVDNGG